MEHAFASLVSAVLIMHIRQHVRIGYDDDSFGHGRFPDATASGYTPDRWDCRKLVEAPSAYRGAQSLGIIFDLVVGLNWQ